MLSADISTGLLPAWIVVITHLSALSNAHKIAVLHSTIRATGLLQGMRVHPGIDLDLGWMLKPSKRAFSKSLTAAGVLTVAPHE